MSSAEAPAPSRARDLAAARHVLVHLLTPMLMCVGMGLAYLGAFVNPSPHHMPVAVVGAGPSTAALAQTIHDKAAAAGESLDVRTVPDREAAHHLLMERQLSGAFVPSDTAPELLVASTNADTSATVAEKVFTPLATAQDKPLKVTDLAPPAHGDPTGQGVFFFLVAVSIGSYASVAVLGGAGAVLRMRARAAFVVVTSFAVSLIGAALAGPVFHVVSHGLWGVWGMAWLYSAGILFLGVGLHTFLKRWTTLTMMVLFVMLNFTTSGGLYRPELLNGFFGALHSFWNGAGLVEGLRSLVYFDHVGLSRHVLTLVAWLVVGLLATTAAGLYERRRRRAALAATSEPPHHHAAARAKNETPEEHEEREEEMDESVGV
ncbi:hypothetical protein ACQYWQ_25435 [Streptomyces sp. P6-2-1]|uniref:hypothetical protein n=1 Tax=Streptomyces sp. P6-2-1 TaxID=3422591 RepID=UPI003D35D91D